MKEAMSSIFFFCAIAIQLHHAHALYRGLSQANVIVLGSNERGQLVGPEHFYFFLDFDTTYSQTFHML
jgi:hypothetical protein